MIDDGWIPYYYLGQREIAGPVCPDCRLHNLRLVDGEWESAIPPAIASESDSPSQQPKKRTKLPVYYVATLARYILVEATDAAEAKCLAQIAVKASQQDSSAPAQIRTVRLATSDELEMQFWHDQMVAAKSACEFCRQEFNRPAGEFTCPYCGLAWPTRKA